MTAGEKLSPYAETMLANFRGRQHVALNEVKERCGFSTHEALVAVQELRKAGACSGLFELGGLVSFKGDQS